MVSYNLISISVISKLPGFQKTRESSDMVKNFISVDEHLMPLSVGQNQMCVSKRHYSGMND